jgi:fucose 4-O-acetylase-like acetyltransferase
MKERIGWIDITKGIAIILVVVGHTLIGLKLNDYIFAFHMPVFFICSGILFRQKDIKAVAVNNAKKLLIPFYVSSVIAIITRAISAYLQNWTPEMIKTLTVNTAIGALFGYGSDGGKWFFTVWMIGAIWFLWAFFWSNLIIQLVFKYTKDWEEWKRACLVITISLISCIIGQYIWIPTNIDIGGFAIIFIYVGYLFRKVRIWEAKKIPWYMYILFVLIWLEDSKLGGINMVIRFLPSYLSVPGAIAATLILMKLSCFIEKIRYISTILCWCGKNTLKILCVHYIELVLIPWDKVVTLAGFQDRRITQFIFRMIFVTVVVMFMNMFMKLIKKRQSN